LADLSNEPIRIEPEAEFPKNEAQATSNETDANQLDVSWCRR